METKKLSDVNVVANLGDNDFITCIMQSSGEVVKVKKSDLLPLASTSRDGLLDAATFSKIKQFGDKINQLGNRTTFVETNIPMREYGCVYVKLTTGITQNEIALQDTSFAVRIWAGKITSISALFTNITGASFIAKIIAFQNANKCFSFAIELARDFNNSGSSILYQIVPAGDGYVDYKNAVDITNTSTSVHPYPVGSNTNESVYSFTV